MNWVRVCSSSDVEEDDVIPIALDGREYAIFRSETGEFFASDGYCTHERALLCDGLVMDGVIECPRHNGRFDYRTGAALGAPVVVNLRTYPTKLDGDDLLIQLDE